MWLLDSKSRRRSLATLRSSTLLVWVSVSLCLAVLAASALVHAAPAAAISTPTPTSQAPPTRIVSINPSLTSILIALGAVDTLVGVDDYSATNQKEVAHLPRVGGLFNPSLESVVALRPGLVVLVPSAEQRDFRRRLEELGIAVAAFENVRFDEVMENIERLGALTGHVPEARARVDAIRRKRAVVAKLATGRSRPKVLVVLQRDPIFVAGRGSFIEQMLDTLGADNLAGEFADPYPRVAVEWVVARAPEVVIDLSPGSEDPTLYWSRWPSLPAVADGRVLRVDAALVSMPGPDLDRSLEVLGGALYGDAFVSEIANEMAEETDSQAGSRAEAPAEPPADPRPRPTAPFEPEQRR